MKKMISCIASLALIAAIPSTAAFAADIEPASEPIAVVSTDEKTDISNIVGHWKYQIAEEGKNVTSNVTDSGFIDVKDDGTYVYTDLDGNTHTGTVRVDYDTFGGTDHVPFFAFYEGDKFFVGCYCDQNDRDVYITGNGGMSQLVREAQSNDSSEKNAVPEILDEKNADKKEIAVSKMEDFNTIMAIMNASPMYTVVDAVVNDHVLVTDERFTNIADFKNFIADTVTGDLRDRFINECDECFTEYDGSLYVKTVGRSFFNFETEYGIAVIDPAMDGFSALTIGGNQLFGNGKADFRSEDGKWKISNYEYGEWRDIMAVESYDFSSVAGIWYEDTEGSSSVFNIRTDGKFTYSYDGGSDFGTLQPMYWLNENEEKIIGLELVNNSEMSFHAGFKAPEESPCNDIYLEQEGSSVHFIRHEEPGKYTVEQLSDMAAKDYEEKTGVRPANTLPMINADDSVTVALYDENKEPFDAYILDPDTGKGEIHSDKSAVNLPQTGNNSLGTAGMAAAAMMFTIAGAFAVVKSGLLRKKENEE
ncbi:hypothetical protein [Ruminococcus flavefaciens]|uniref:LPXTG-motif cell wall anchor domain-containing protein n=1 Tax=Ruminococcus flavefaciens TaxID=1265 RepID=A0A1M7JNS1_RUMFL|nr:hypothetical protein [Ruminococcus flavefaciens]SHM54545.1 hypothetical protein SAMN04487860_106122 [Ruminococcus flavefaciens]